MRGRLKRSVGSHPRFRQHWRASTPTSKSTHPNYGKLPGHTCPHEAACVRRLPHPEQIHRWNGRGKECGLRGLSLRPAVSTVLISHQRNQGNRRPIVRLCEILAFVVPCNPCLCRDAHWLLMGWGCRVLPQAVCGTFGHVAELLRSEKLTGPCSATARWSKKSVRALSSCLCVCWRCGFGPGRVVIGEYEVQRRNKMSL